MKPNIALNLLANRTCDNCWWGMSDQINYSLPPNKTCKHWIEDDEYEKEEEEIVFCARMLKTNELLQLYATRVCMQQESDMIWNLLKKKLTEEEVKLLEENFNENYIEVYNNYVERNNDEEYMDR